MNPDEIYLASFPYGGGAGMKRRPRFEFEERAIRKLSAQSPFRVPGAGQAKRNGS
jgi:hypothetical protein